MNKLYIILAILLIIAVFASRAMATAPQKVTICHATESDGNPYTQIVVSENAIGAHFENPGTPKAGHEDDLFFAGEVECPGGEEPTPTPTPKVSCTPTPTTEPTPTVTITPTTQPERVVETNTGGQPDGLGCAVHGCNPVDTNGNPVKMLPPSQSGK